MHVPSTRCCTCIPRQLCAIVDAAVMMMMVVVTTMTTMMMTMMMMMLMVVVVVLVVVVMMMMMIVATTVNFARKCHCRSHHLRCFNTCGSFGGLSASLLASLGYLYP